MNTAPNTCGIVFTDNLADPETIDGLRSLSGRLMDALGESSTMARESLNLQWINLHNIFRKANTSLFKERDYESILMVSEIAKVNINRIQLQKYSPSTAYGNDSHIQAAHLIIID